MLAHDNVLASVDSFHRIVPAMDHRIVSLLPLSHLLEQSVGLFYALSVGADILYVRSLNPRVIFDALRAHRVTSMVVVPAGARPLLEPDRARGGQARPDRGFDRLRAVGRRLPARHPAVAVPECPRPVRRAIPAVRVGGGVPATGRPAGLGGPRRHRAPGLRDHRDRHRQLHDARGPRSRHGRANPGRDPDAARRRTARSSSAGRRCSRATGATRPPRPRRSPRTAGTGPATSAISTRPGRLILSGRSKDMIVLPNGFNVYPEDIENALRIAGSARFGGGRDATRPDRGDRPRGGGAGAAMPRRSGATIDGDRQGSQRAAGPEPADRGLAALAGGGLPAHPHAQDQAGADPRLGDRRHRPAGVAGRRRGSGRGRRRRACRSAADRERRPRPSRATAGSRAPRGPGAAPGSQS